MQIKIDPHAPLPIYAQIIAEITANIASSALITGETLPSVRHLAQQLEINSLTVQKAYKILENDGIISIRKGVGATVNEGALLKIRENIGPDVFSELGVVINKAKNLGVPRQEIHSFVDNFWEGKES